MTIDFLAVLQTHPSISLVERIETCEIESGAVPFQTFRIHACEDGHVWRLVISISDLFPRELPLIGIENAEDYPAIGHINWLGDVCYKDKQGLVVDYLKPDHVLIECIYEALNTLNANYADSKKSELQYDFKSYWESNRIDDFLTTCVVTPGQHAKQLVAFRDTKFENKAKTQKCLALIENDTKINRNFNLIQNIADKKRDASIYIPLSKEVIPPAPKQKWNATDIVEAFEDSVSNDAKSSALTILETFNWSNYFVVVFSHPKPDGEYNLWGVQFHRKDKAKHPLLDPKNDWKVSPMPLRISTAEYLFSRSSNSIKLNNKKIAIVGCGSVGGSVAMQLAKAGVGALHLIDPDKMEIDNIYRHVLGATAIDNLIGGAYKVDVLAWDIELNIPFTEVTPIKDTLHNFGLIKNIFNFYDAIVIATGDFTNELFFNAIHKDSTIVKPVIYTWQDGFGIGGHAICVSNNKSPGCLECLYTKDDGFEAHTKTSFIKYGQTISKHLGGCSGVFTPYSFLDASQTALLATRMTLDALQGKAVNEIRSWKGSDEQLKAEGHSPSIWYGKSPEYFIKDDRQYIASNCSVCGKYHQI